jgi:hypothetical protein
LIAGDERFLKIVVTHPRAPLRFAHNEVYENGALRHEPDDFKLYQY